MGRAPCCTKIGLHKGPWTPREDTLLTKYIQSHGEGHWRSLPKKAGLLRCGKSCRLRWMNYLRPNIKRGNITPDEDDLIIRLHSLLGNRWSLIAGRLPGRTDNEIKNYWNTHLSKRVGKHGSDPTWQHRKLALERKSSRKESTSEWSEATTIKVHLPKAVRVSATVMMPKKDVPTRGDRECNSSSCTNNVDLLSPWCDFNLKEVGFLGDADVGNAEYGWYDNSLEKLYEEYLQLLNDSNQLELGQDDV